MYACSNLYIYYYLINEQIPENSYLQLFTRHICCDAINEQIPEWSYLQLITLFTYIYIYITIP